MFNDIKKFKVDYCFLGFITLIFAFLFLVKKLDTVFLLWLTAGYGLSYILWGVWHHHRLNNLSGKVVLEYFLVVGFALAIVSTLLLG